MGSAVLRLRARLCWRIFPYRREAVLKTVRAQAFASGCALLSECSQNFRQIAVAFRKVHSERLQKSGEQNFDGALFGSKRLRAPNCRSTKRARGGVFAGHLHIPDQLGLCAKKKFASLRMQYVKTAVFWHTFKLTGLPQPSVGLWAWPCTGRVYFGQFFEICLGKCDFSEIGHFSGSFCIER